jgi:hypothetical protein
VWLDEQQPEILEEQNIIDEPASVPTPIEIAKSNPTNL